MSESTDSLRMLMRRIDDPQELRGLVEWATVSRLKGGDERFAAIVMSLATVRAKEMGVQL